MELQTGDLPGWGRSPAVDFTKTCLVSQFATFRPTTTINVWLWTQEKVFSVNLG